jgi:hypothetical protein
MDGARCRYNQPSWGTFEPVRVKTCSLWNSRNILSTYMAWIGITSSWIALSNWKVYLSKNIDNYLRRWIIMCGQKYLSHFYVETLRHLYLYVPEIYVPKYLILLITCSIWIKRSNPYHPSFFPFSRWLHILCEWKSIIRFYYANGMISALYYFDRMRIEYPRAKWPWSTMVLK